MITVSVIIPTYNYARYICEAIESVLKQEYPIEQIEIIVIDDGSTDTTKEALQAFIDNGTIQYYYQENKGKANATDFAIQKSMGKYIFTLDADDYFLPEKITTSVNVFEADSEIVHVATSYKYLNQETKELGIEKLPADILEKPLNGNWLLRRFYNNNLLYGGGSTYAARSSVLKKIYIPETVDMFIDEFLILAILPYGKSYFLQEPLSVWRVHNSNYSGRTLIKEQQEEKELRLIKSSAAVFAYLRRKKFDKELLKIYQLKDATRRIAFKETLNNKKITDIFQYASEVFLQIQPRWKLIKKYNVINRLLPSFLYRWLKKLSY